MYTSLMLTSALAIVLARAHPGRTLVLLAVTVLALHGSKPGQRHRILQALAPLYRAAYPVLPSFLRGQAIKGW
jgi:hypothetical protein